MPSLSRPQTLTAALTALAVTALACPAFARTIQVSTSGNDAGDGVATPYRTLKKAASSAVAGDVIQLGAGTFHETTTVSLPGGVVLAGTGRDATTLTSDQSPMVRIEGVSNIEIRDLALDGRARAIGQALYAHNATGLEIHHFRMDGFDTALTLHNVTGARVHDFVGTNPAYCTSNAISLTEQATDVEVYNGDVLQDDNTPGKIVGSAPNSALETVPGQPWTAPRARITRLRVHDINHQTPARGCWEVPGSPGNFPPGFSMELWHSQLSEVEVYANHVRSGYSIQSNGYDYAAIEKSIHIHHNFMDLRNEYRFAVEVSTHNMVIDHNYFLGGCYPIASFESGVASAIRNLKVTNNVFAEQVISNLVYNITTGVSGALFVHNTVYATTGNGIFGISGTQDILVRNNIFVGTGNWDIAGVGGTVDHNLYQGVTSKGGNVVPGDPKLNGSGGKPAPWYELQTGSPAIDAGVAMPGVDDGYSGSAPDLGAFERGAVAWAVGPGSVPIGTGGSGGAGGAGGAGTGGSSSAGGAGAGGAPAAGSAGGGKAGSGGGGGGTNGACQGGGCIEAESYASMNGVTNKGTVIGSCDQGDWVRYTAVDFGAGYSGIAARVAVDDAHAGQKVEYRLDSPTGNPVGTLTVAKTGGWSSFTNQSTSLAGAAGVHDLYVVFVATGADQAGVGDFDWFQLTDPVSGGGAGAGGTGPGGRAGQSGSVATAGGRNAAAGAGALGGISGAPAASGASSVGGAAPAGGAAAVASAAGSGPGATLWMGAGTAAGGMGPDSLGGAGGARSANPTQGTGATTQGAVADPAGCGCSSVGGGTGTQGALAAVTLGLGLLLRRRSRRAGAR